MVAVLPLVQPAGVPAGEVTVRDERTDPGDRDLAAVPKPNSIALRIAMVAAGEADLVASTRLGNEWDIAAAALIAGEAGAAVSDARGQALRFNTERAEAIGVIACAAGLHGAAVERFGV